MQWLTNVDHKPVAYKSVAEYKTQYYKDVQVLNNQFKGTFESSYQNYSHEGHPPFTSYSKDHHICIDYIMFSKGSFKVNSVLQMPQNESDLSPSIPNKWYPSDHLRIEAVIEFNH